MKPGKTVVLFLLLCMLLAGCQNAQLSDVQEVSPTERSSPTPQAAPTLNPEASLEEKKAFYRNAVENGDRVVSFSQEDGFYAKDVSLNLTAEGALDIYYTDDGSEPGPSSLEYTHPIVLTATDAELPRCAVIRAVAYYPDGMKSPVYTCSYFLNKNIGKRFSMPVFSIIASPEELTNGPTALLVGKRAQDTDENAKRSVLLQVFEKTGEKAIDQPAVLRVYGSSSRDMPVKSLQLTAGTEEEAQAQYFSYAVFDTSNLQGETMDHYSRLVLSNSEDDFQYAFIRDEFAQRLAKSALIQDYEEVRPAVVYINGDYYGLHWLHEYYSTDFFQAVYGTSAGRYVVINWTAESGPVPVEPEDTAAAAQFQSAYERLLAADFQSEEGRTLLHQLIDVENYLDLCALNILIDNANWPSQMQAYAYLAPDGEAQSMQWRFLPHGMSNSFGFKGSKDAALNDTLGDALNPESARYARLFSKLMEDQEYRAYFVERVTGLLADKWSKDALLSTLKELHNERNSEMQHYFARIEALRKTRNSGVWMKKNDFNTAYNSLNDYVKARPGAVIQQLEQHFPVDSTN